VITVPSSSGTIHSLQSTGVDISKIFNEHCELAMLFRKYCMHILAGRKEINRGGCILTGVLLLYVQGTYRKLLTEAFED
jgi:hypothetical protein